MNPTEPPCEVCAPAPAGAAPPIDRLVRLIRQGGSLADTLFLNNIIDAVADPILVKDHHLRFVLVNQALCDFTGIPRERFIGRTDADLFPADQARTFNAMDRGVFATRRPNVNEEALLHADGSLRTIRTTKTTFVAEDGTPVLVGIFTDLTALRAAQRELQTANRQLHDLAHHDSLTGLPNRMAFELTLKHLLASAQRHGDVFSVLFMDLNGFKQVNDHYGHCAGDQLIHAAGARLAGSARASDFIARLGGDEFVVLARTQDDFEARCLAERIALDIGRPFALAAAEVSISVSIGIARYPRDGTSGPELIKNADIAMYRAKRDTGQAFEFYDEAQSAVAKRLFLLQGQLRRDVDDGAIEIHVQPIVRLDDACVLGFEALARWRHPTLGAIAPSEFIALAERHKLIGALGHLVLRRACEFIARHGAPGQYVSVNVSSLQIEDTGFADSVQRVLAESGAAASQLALELTESAFETPAAAAALRRIRAAGIALFIDDFGVGYSNLLRLQNLPFDVIKIDRDFVGAIGADGSGLAMVRTIAVLAAELGLTVIAEGIEHAYQARALRGLGIGLGQGYLYGRPGLPPA